MIQLLPFYYLNQSLKASEVSEESPLYELRKHGMKYFYDHWNISLLYSQKIFQLYLLNPLISLGVYHPFGQINLMEEGMELVCAFYNGLMLVLLAITIPFLLVY